jgi:hypothetical protein
LLAINYRSDKKRIKKDGSQEATIVPVCRYSFPLSERVASSLSHVKMIQSFVLLKQKEANSKLVLKDV